jgi:hypothetical protein
MRPRLALTMFEDQVIRNYLGTPNHRFIDELEAFSKVFILTNKEKANVITALINQKKFNLNEKIIILEPFDRGFAQRILASLSRISNQSFSNKWSTRRNLQNGQTKLLNFVGKEVLHFLLCRSKQIKRMIRFFFSQTVTDSSNYDCIQKLNLEVLVLTSATNYEWDATIGNIGNKLNIKTIGIPRSWDNLTSHGLIRFFPDQLIVFSENMKKYALKYQDINNENVKIALNPAYQYMQVPKRSKQYAKPKILYACMGKVLYEKENVFLNLLTDIQSSIGSFHLTILEHPKFQLDKSVENLDNVDWKRIDYSKRNSAKELYKLLSEQDLVLTLGSSVALDCIFTRTPVAIVAMDTNPKFWASANRYIDKVEHFADLVAEEVFEVINTKNGLLATLEHYTGRRREIDEEEVKRLRKIVAFQAPYISWTIKNLLVSQKEKGSQ